MKNLETKFDEIVKTTSDINEMRDMYLADRLLRTWKEDFIDEDTGEAISIERNEIILERGTFLDSDKLSEINFHLQSGDIEKVSVSNQCRECRISKNRPSVWLVTIELNQKKKNIYLYANSIEMARDIAIDFIEQKYSGAFKFKAAKELDYSNLISTDIDTSNEKETHYYKVQVEVSLEEEESTTQDFILNASDAEKAKLTIIRFLTKLREEKGEKEPFETTIISAKTISCNDVINHEFSKKYFENKEDE